MPSHGPFRTPKFVLYEGNAGQANPIQKTIVDIIWVLIGACKQRSTRRVPDSRLQAPPPPPTDLETQFDYRLGGTDAAHAARVGNDPATSGCFIYNGALIFPSRFLFGEREKRESSSPKML